jgi:zinc/manganese transport system permease protein
MRRALVGALALSLSGAPIGVFLILRRMALTGDAMAHAILPGAALGYLDRRPVAGGDDAGGLAAGLVVALARRWWRASPSLREDATLAAFYLISLALGVTIVSLRGSNVDLLRVLFGSVLALDDATLFLLAGIRPDPAALAAAIPAVDAGDGRSRLFRLGQPARAVLRKRLSGAGRRSISSPVSMRSAR